MGVVAGVRKASAGQGGVVDSAAKGAKMARMDTRKDRIERTLSQAFPAARVQVDDDSAKHAGHAGAQPGGQTHYTVHVVTEAFAGQGRLARSRAVHALLAGEFAAGLHALALTLRTPDEAARDG
jgi:BolA family transcriptional regulator, general stress-responsive regulator